MQCSAGKPWVHLTHTTHLKHLYRLSAPPPTLPMHHATLKTWSGLRIPHIPIPIDYPWDVPHFATHRTQRIHHHCPGARHLRTPPEVLCPSLNRSEVPSWIGLGSYLSRHECRTSGVPAYPMDAWLNWDLGNWEARGCLELFGGAIWECRCLEEGVYLVSNGLLMCHMNARTQGFPVL